VVLGGRDGEGYCIGAVDVPGASGLLVTAVGDDASEPGTGVVYGACSAVEATAVMRWVFLPTPEGTLLFASTTPKADVVEVTSKSGTTQRAKTVSLDSAPGVAFFAVTVDDPDDLSGLDELDAAGELIVKPNEVPRCQQ
jgi:hypothetical protein